MQPVSADKYGPKIGGFISGLPSTVLFSLFFLAWIQNPHFAVQATTVIPITAGVENVSALSYVFLIKKNLWFALFVSFLLWFILALGLFHIQFNNYVLSLIAYVVSLIIFYFFVMAVRYTYIPFGIIGGTIISALISLMSGYVVYRLIIKNLK